MRSAILAMLAVATGCAAEAPAKAPTPTSAVPLPPRKKGEARMIARHAVDYLQSCGTNCRFSVQSVGLISVTLRPDQSATAKVVGQTLESFNPGRSRLAQQALNWERKWQGSWTRRGARIDLLLGGEDRTCTAAPGDTDAGARCAPMERLELKCKRRRVSLAQRSPRAVPSWTCRRRGPKQRRAHRTEGFPALPWVFSDDGFLVSVDAADHDRLERRYFLPDPDRDLRVGWRPLALLQGALRPLAGREEPPPP